MMRTHKLVLGVALLGVLMGHAAAWAQQTVLEVIPLKYRRVDEVIPVLQAAGSARKARCPG